MNMCRTFDEYSRARAGHYQSVGLVRDKKLGAQNPRNPYSTSIIQNDNRSIGQKIIASQSIGGGSARSSFFAP